MDGVKPSGRGRGSKTASTQGKKQNGKEAVEKQEAHEIVASQLPQGNKVMKPKGEIRCFGEPKLENLGCMKQQNHANRETKGGEAMPRRVIAVCHAMS